MVVLATTLAVGAASFSMRGSLGRVLDRAENCDSMLTRLRERGPGVAHTIHYADLSRLSEMKQVAAESEAEIFFSHDMDAWNGYKHAPDFYEG